MNQVEQLLCKLFRDRPLARAKHSKRVACPTTLKVCSPMPVRVELSLTIQAPLSIKMFRCKHTSVQGRSSLPLLSNPK